MRVSSVLQAKAWSSLPLVLLRVCLRCTDAKATGRKYVDRMIIRRVRATKYFNDRKPDRSEAMPTLAQQRSEYFPRNWYTFVVHICCPQ